QGAPRQLCIAQPNVHPDEGVRRGQSDKTNSLWENSRYWPPSTTLHRGSQSSCDAGTRPPYCRRYCDCARLTLFRFRRSTESHNSDSVLCSCRGRKMSKYFHVDCSNDAKAIRESFVNALCGK